MAFGLPLDQLYGLVSHYFFIMVRIGALLSGQAGYIRQVQAYDEKRVEAQKFQSEPTTTPAMPSP